MKKLLFATSILFCATVSFSQGPELTIQTGPKGTYLQHKVAPKEGLFPLGRMYNVHPRHIANFNGIDFNKGLAIGQQINIPLSDTNFKTTVNKGIPVYYKPTSTESLTNISAKTKVPANRLREWNSPASDNVQAGTKLIVGFLITNEMQDRVVTITPKALDAEPSVSNVKKAEEQKQQTGSEPKADVTKKTEPSVSNVNKAEAQKKQMESEQKTDGTKTEPSVSNVNKAEAQKKQMDPEQKTDLSTVKQTETGKDDGTGYFKGNFYQQVKTAPAKKEQTVTSSIFKTTSGWQDGKYYLLINGVEPGTIVKITNPSNSKIVYAKVLYAMDKIRENQGVDIRISDAAASSLAVSETDKFILKVNY